MLAMSRVFLYIEFLISLILLVCTSEKLAASTTKRGKFDSNTLNATQNGVSIDRDSDNDMITADVHGKSEERVFSDTLAGMALTLFDHLKLKTPEGKLFDHPRFKIWVDFIFHYDWSHGEGIVFKNLVARYDDYTLASILAAERNAPSVHGENVFVINLQRRQYERWQLEKTYSSDKVFELLKLDKEGNLFLSPLFDTWVDFITHIGEVPKNVILGTQDRKELVRRLNMLVDAKKESAMMKKKLSQLFQ
ncbi:hypothetical protein PsorP6_016818 [Peronosclerospora sorghi]|uniref:Uncharacterized protein n=1 Tax=Peronosclerospora sorghi TaxID=230839 RepID=A0ACC0WFW8_9STRA|nr:hypothetical protein PsorP6_016818 [Peronosclerospora sorghi]